MKNRSVARRVVRHPLLRSALLASAIMAPSHALAQATPAVETTPSQSQEGTTVDVAVDVGGGYTDNLFATRNYEVDDFLIIARPSLRITAFDGENRFTLRGEGELGRYAEHESEDYNDWLIGADGRLRASPGVVLLGGADYRWEHESRTSPEAQNGSEPTRYQLLHAFGGAILGSGPFTVRPAVILDRFDFKDVPAGDSTINNDDRDRTQVEFGARFSQRVESGTYLLLQGVWNSRDYRQSVDDIGFRRDSRGGSVNAGIRKVFSPSLNGELMVGYLTQNYRDPRLETVSAIDVGATLDWTAPNGLGLAFRLDRSVEETTLPGASSYLFTSSSLTLRASPHPTVEAGITLGGSLYDYRGDPRSEFVTSADLWARHWLSRNIYAQLDYELSQRTSNAAGFDYDENRLFLRLGARLRPHHTGSVVPLAFGANAPAGVYAGLFVGHGALVTGLDGPRGQGSNTADFGDTGVGFGAMAGYGVAIGNAYFGGEIEGSLDGPDWLHVAERVFSAEKKGSVGVAARAGWLTPDKDLVYGRIGLSRTQLRTSYDLFEHSFDDKEWRTGLNFGVGAEASAGTRGFVRAEYVLTSYDDINVSSGRSDDRDNMSSSEGQFRVGAGLRFGAAAKRAVAPLTKFTGPYAGVQIGHGALVSRNFGARERSQAIDISRAGQGPLLGIFAGYGAALRSFYVGLEAEADISRIDWNIEREPTGRIYSARRQLSFGGAARAGWLISNSALLYARMGTARTRFVIPYATTNRSVLSEESRTGLRLGAGLEIGLGTRDRLRIDYTLTDYRVYNVEYGENSDRFDHDENVVRIGVAHAF
jgi:hypothetical protein